MKQKLIRFMQGRYGADALSRFLLILTAIFIVISLFIRGPIFDILGMACIIYSYIRMFSKNIPKRYAENQVYLKYQNKVTYWFRTQKSDLKQRKTHHIYRCPSCRQKIRVPKGRGKIAIRCPKCSTEFIKRS